MNNEDLQQLKALAMWATPGPWSYNGNCRFGVWQDEGKFYVFEAGSQADAEYIAAANPAAILALLARIESLAADAERYKFLREVDPDAEDPAIMIHVQNDWGNWAYMPLNGKEADQAIDTAIAKEKA